MTDPRPAPYPPDTRAKGWRFELDMERARQSDTWALATPEARPWLLMMWATAWEQTPCGSLPNDDELIAARIGMPIKAFIKSKPILLRKWWLADDGRLYHSVLIQRVMEMMQTRRKESDRKALARARATAGVHQESTVVPVLSRGTDAGFPPESDTGTGTGTYETTGTKEVQNQDPPPPSASPPPPADAGNHSPPKSPKPEPWLTTAELEADGIGLEISGPWLAHRRAKKAKLTALAWAGFKAEADKAGWPYEQAVLKAIARNWTGFEAAWVANDRQQVAATETAYQRSMRERVAEISPGLARKAPGASPQNREVFDVEAKRIS